MFRGGTGEILKRHGDVPRRLMTALDRTRLTDKTAKKDGSNAIAFEPSFSFACL